MKICSLLILLLLSFVPALAQNGSDAPSASIPTITFCDLIQSHDLFNDKEVRFRATYLAGPEVAAFIDPACATKGNATWAEFDGISIKAFATPEIFKRVESQIFVGGTKEAKQWRATEVLVTGIFNASDIGHGHLGKYRFMVTVKKVEEISETEKTTAPGAGLP